MVGADRFDESAGERGTVTSLPDDSYWSNIDYPEPRPRPPAAVGSVARDRGSIRRRLSAGFVAALLVIGGGAYAVGRTNGHAPVPGLHRQVEAQRSELERRAATIATQARELTADEARLRALRAQASHSAAIQTACQHAISVANRAFGTESDALHALAATDFAAAKSLTDLFGTELDEFAGARSTCLGSTTAV
jgi:hypothetical protein